MKEAYKHPCIVDAIKQQLEERCKEHLVTTRQINGLRAELEQKEMLGSAQATDIVAYQFFLEDNGVPVEEIRTILEKTQGNMFRLSKAAA